jgi:hypothetical protein
VRQPVPRGPAEPRRRPDARRADYTCDDRAAARSQQIVSRLLLRKRLTCLPMGGNYYRVVALRFVRPAISRRAEMFILTAALLLTCLRNDSARGVKSCSNIMLIVAFD